MYSLFGTKWNKLHCGPMWSVVPVMQVENSSPCVHRIPSEVSLHNIVPIFTAILCM